MIAYQKKFIRIAEYWDTEPAGHPKVDLVRFFQQSEPVADSLSREFYSLLLDLEQDESALLAGMKKTTRYEIRRAQISDHFLYQIGKGTETSVLSDFCEHYNEFAAVKGQPRINQMWLSMLAIGDLLRISRIQDSSGDTLVWHAYHFRAKRATLLYSASILRSDSNSVLRSKVGRANRYHHWQDILHFKQHGIAIYDFGGWYEGKEDRARLRINKFKEGFGGKIAKTYICERPLTFRGWVFLKTRTLLLGNAI
jgi:hypothetical protein